MAHTLQPLCSLLNIFRYRENRMMGEPCKLHIPFLTGLDIHLSEIQLYYFKANHMKTNAGRL